jgi:hypothetical protein
MIEIDEEEWDHLFKVSVNGAGFYFSTLEKAQDYVKNKYPPTQRYQIDEIWERTVEF